MARILVVMQLPRCKNRHATVKNSEIITYYVIQPLIILQFGRKTFNPSDHVGLAITYRIPNSGLIEGSNQKAVSRDRDFPNMAISD